jgi:hypothetical protein
VSGVYAAPDDGRKAEMCSDPVNYVQHLQRLFWRKKVKTSLLQAVEAYRVVRGRGSHIVQANGSQLAIRLLDSCAGRTLLPRNIIFLLLVLISVRG